MPARNLMKFAVPAGVVAIVVMMVVPLPAMLLDMLLATNITISLLVLLVSMYVKRPLDFAVFPAILLILTLYRLALNISTTRLVLLDGYAGKVVEAFGTFAIGGSLVVGLVIFAILVVIQFTVITAGATRVAEVGARFTLDAMPGKQMAIDADLNSGLIDEDQARTRRADVSAEADFYGAMDGASKFVKGDAMAGIIITIINLVAGMAIGITQKGLTPGEAVQKYSLLTIGDGLVSQIPALLMSVATGLIVTRATTHGDMGSDVIAQLAGQRKALLVGGAAAMGMCLIPGMPPIPFLLIGGIVFFLGLRAKQDAPELTDDMLALGAAPDVAPNDTPEQIVHDMQVDPLALRVAFDLVDLVDPLRGGDLLDRVKALRRKVALDQGLLMPLVRTRDDLDLPPSTYVITVHGIDRGRGTAPPGHVLAIGDALDALPGTPTTEPVFGLAGKWVPAELRHQAELSGATVVDRASVIITHLAEVVRAEAASLLGREDVKLLVDAVRRSHPSVVEDLTPGALGLGEIQFVLRRLLDEDVPIRDLVRIFEAMASRARTSVEPDGLVDAVRQGLGAAICLPYVVDDVLPVLTLEPHLEHSLLEQVRTGETGSAIVIDSGHAERVLDELQRLLAAAEALGKVPVLVCSAPLRSALHRLIHPALPRLAVLAYGEVGGHFAIETLGMVSDVRSAAA